MDAWGEQPEKRSGGEYNRQNEELKVSRKLLNGLHEKEETEPQLRSSVTPKTAEENSGQKTTHLGTHLVQ